AEIAQYGFDREIFGESAALRHVCRDDDRLRSVRLVDEIDPASGRARDGVEFLRRRLSLLPRAERVLERGEELLHRGVAGDDERAVVRMEPVAMPGDEIVARQLVERCRVAGA